MTIPLEVTLQGGATAADYSGIPETVTFGADQTAVTFTVTATADTDAETGERVSIGFGTLPEGVFARSPATATVTLADRSGPGPGPTTDPDPTARPPDPEPDPAQNDDENSFPISPVMGYDSLDRRAPDAGALDRRLILLGSYIEHIMQTDPASQGQAQEEPRWLPGAQPGPYRHVKTSTRAP